MDVRGKNGRVQNYIRNERKGGVNKEKKVDKMEAREAKGGRGEIDTC